MDAVAEAENTVQELRTALAQAGITLPSLGLDPVTLVRERPTPLVELGRCTPETAQRLVRALSPQAEENGAEEDRTAGGTA
ncbi:hypothetical protein [Streptomyces odontomachi]|uniref:hypothetical protein n=1 Tax=Streptomyces odontomachi TaxID=2944940 RepID=UPI00210E5F00|nr:hypothetical protein [Streptomyces sp. ODS25]